MWRFSGTNKRYYPSMKMYKQCILRAIIITLIEYVAGYILNIKLELEIWNYTNLKYNLNGQISLLFSFISMLNISDEYDSKNNSLFFIES